MLYLVVVSRGGLLVGGPQGLKLGIQYVQQLLNQSHRRADISGLDPTPRVVHQLSCYVGRVLAALYLQVMQGQYQWVLFKAVGKLTVKYLHAY